MNPSLMWYPGQSPHPWSQGRPSAKQRQNKGVTTTLLTNNQKGGRKGGRWFQNDLTI